ncbi:MAG: hypothetical protein JNK82_38970 [Myxococcaceae bacterium]|nr:hypothetical protein [Myxococcaceae bacterium]
MGKSSFVAIATFCLLSSCAAMHAVTGDAMFAPDEPTKTAVKEPDVPEAEPNDAHLESAPKWTPPDEEDLVPLPTGSPTAAKKKSGAPTAAR